jgi:hypothetical protein
MVAAVFPVFAISNVTPVELYRRWSNCECPIEEVLRFITTDEAMWLILITPEKIFIRDAG